MNPAKKNNSAENAALILQVYLAIFVIALTIFFVFKFYEYQPVKLLDIRDYYASMLFDSFDVVLQREGSERFAYVLSAIFSALTIFLSQKFLVRKIEKNFQDFAYYPLILFSIYALSICSIVVLASSALILRKAQKVVL